METTQKHQVVTLGKKTIGYYIGLFLLTPFWFLSLSPNKKSWIEFKNGMISHKHEWDTEVVKGEYFPYNKCKHSGCFTINPLD